MYHINIPPKHYGVTRVIREIVLPPVTAQAVMPTVAPALVPAVQITAPQVVVPVVGPAVPAEGIPVGWTMEQWNYYGQQWLVDQGRV